MEPSVDDLREWWDYVAPRRGPFKIESLHGPVQGTQRCARGRESVFCLRKTVPNGVYITGDSHTTSWRYMHVDCAEQTLRELQEYDGPWKRPDEPTRAEPQDLEPEPELPVEIAVDEETGEVSVKGADHELILEHGTQADFVAMFKLHEGQPIIGMAKKYGKRYGHDVHGWYVWQPVE